MEQAEIGLIGLAVMGANLALNIAEKGYRVAVYNRTYAKTEEFYKNAGDLQDKIIPCKTLEEFAAAIRPPRPIIIMIKAGEPVDEQLQELAPHLSDNDIMIDAGNANFRDTIRRFNTYKDTGLTFMGIGVSGGEEGARHGPSIMVGGTETSWKRVEPILTAIAARYDGEPCVARMGNDGAGHFVKTIHNGIEYADMQMIAEIYGIFREGLKKDAHDISNIFGEWNKGRLNSYLIEITATVLGAKDPISGMPMVDMIVDKAGQKGTGKWSVIEAQNMNVPATSIEAAVAARCISALKDQRQAAAKLFGAQNTNFSIPYDDALNHDLAQALLAAKIAAYAQGFVVMAEASRDYNWSLPMPEIAKIWRAGCIIRSQFLDDIAKAFVDAPDAVNLIVTPTFAAMVKEALPSLRRITCAALQAGLPVPALSAALNYFDSYKQERGTANLIQAQRDFFGAHGFDRIDGKDIHHGPWGSGLADFK
ncbi:NADP-dependent phosphogluconate dehydrogenase [Bartonella sp. HY406]|uniref:NADP-dependent phosphogluconate dehydrogenase n=1 Tax=Bartonella sp. HY406 TaxID=2979331 RepID=UPI0021C86341|nr:NADP-dependent phosphogluconate dehydrogenase [Bartonella sp. HY406]UXN04220.1 NADP-dependent phosphogluconate dehydrogenase [Bartonella sp. HY406]